MAESKIEPLQASTVEIPQSAPAFNGKLLAGIFGGLAIPAALAAGGGKGGKGSDKNTAAQTDTAASEKPSETSAAQNAASHGQTADKPNASATDNKTPAPAVKNDSATAQKPSENPDVSKPVSDSQNAIKPTASATDNKTPVLSVKNDAAATEKPSENPAVSTSVSDGQTATPNDAPAAPVQPEPVRYTSQFTLSNGLSFSIESENEAAEMGKQGYQDSVQPLKADLTTLNVLKSLAEKVDKSVVERAYQPDSDGDGLIDKVDRYPNEWNVSDRDLREFASLAYAKERELKDAFAGYSPTQSISINSIKTKFKDQVDISEYKQHWQVLKFVNSDDIGASGLDYTIFGNGKRWDGTYKNIVVAFRGSSNVGDWIANTNIGLGWLPKQAKETTKIIQELRAYNPEKIYATGHSLGGYLAQFFVSHSVQKSEFQDNFERSVLFNPAILKTRLLTTNSDWKNARKLTDTMVKQPLLDFSNKYSTKTTYKTVSYVVKNEAVSNLLGDYEPSVYMTDPVFNKLLGKHNLNNFYEKSAQVQKYFSQGYRMDKNYQSIDSDSDGLTDYQELLIGTNPNQADSDGDGFSDGIEVKLQADALDADAVPERPEALYLYAKSLELKTEILGSDGSSSADSVILQAQIDKANGEINYQPAYTADAAAAIDARLSAFGATLITGTPGNDIITGSHGRDKIHGGLGSDRLTGGEGADTFVFDAADLNGSDTDTIHDFNTAHDKLDLSGMKHLFSDGREFDFDWKEVLVEGVQADTSRAYLVFDDAAQTLAYQAKGNDAGNIFVRFEGENTHLSADQIV